MMMMMMMMMMVLMMMMMMVKHVLIRQPQEKMQADLKSRTMCKTFQLQASSGCSIKVCARHTFFNVDFELLKGTVELKVHALLIKNRKVSS